jgi:chromosome partitioning protein
MGKTIAVCNQKGGVGKTTTSINLAASLAILGVKTLLVDLDPQANATSGIGIDKKNIKHSIYHVLIGARALQDIIVHTAIDNMFLAPADMHLNGAQIELVSSFNREKRLKTSLETISQIYDIILIDCPPSLGLLTINALTAAETALIPLQCEYYAMEGLSQLLHTIKLVQDHLNQTLSIEGVVLTMADYRTNLTNEVISEARAFFSDKVYNAIIPRSIRLSEAPGHGQPVVVYDKNSNGSLAYQQLAIELITHNTSISNKLQNILQTTHKKPTHASQSPDISQDRGNLHSDGTDNGIDPAHPGAVNQTPVTESTHGGDNG